MEQDFALTFFYTQNSTHFNICHRRFAYGLTSSLSLKDRMNPHGLIWGQPHYDVYFTVAHFIDVIMSAMAPRLFTQLCSVVGQRKHQSSKSLAFVRGIQRWPENVSIWWRHHVLKDTERWYCTKCTGRNLTQTVLSKDSSSRVRSNAQYATRLCIAIFL